MSSRESWVERVHRVRTSRPFVFATMLVSAVVSLVASFVLSVDAWVLAGDPSAQLACDLNSVVSCGAVGRAWQAQVFGFPNAFLGLVAEPVVITVAVASLGGVRFPAWFMRAAQVVYTAGLVFAYWLFSQSLTSIGALCPWCLLVTVSTTLVFVSLTRVNLTDGVLVLPGRVRERVLGWLDVDVDVVVLVVWFGLLALVVVGKYGSALLG
jgi:uncharacterized membrane protein